MPILDPAPPTDALRGLHLFHYGPSTCSQRVRIALAEKELDYADHVVDLAARAQLRPEFLAINPRGLVPALVDNGTRVIESVDIIGYLDQRYPLPPLVGPDAADSNTLRSAADGAQDPLRTLTHEFAFRARGEPRRDDLEAYVRAAPDPEAGAFFFSFADNGPDWATRVDQASRAMVDALDRLERAIDGRPWLEGASFGLADIAWAPTVHRLVTIGWPWERWPLVEQWYGRVAARPSFASAVLAFEPSGPRAALAGYVARRAAEGTGVAQRLSELGR